VRPGGDLPRWPFPPSAVADPPWLFLCPFPPRDPPPLAPLRCPPPAVMSRFCTPPAPVAWAAACCLGAASAWVVLSVLPLILPCRLLPLPECLLSTMVPTSLLRAPASRRSTRVPPWGIRPLGRIIPPSPTARSGPNSIRGGALPRYRVPWVHGPAPRHMECLLPARCVGFRVPFPLGRCVRPLPACC